jgi:hypothetical protein
MASDFEHNFFASFNLLVNSLGGLEFFDEFFLENLEVLKLFITRKLFLGSEYFSS